MALDISQDTLGFALTKLPSQDGPVIQSINSIPYTSKAGSSQKSSPIHHRAAILNLIGSVVKEEGVCGFLVGWPLQPDARPGLDCGRTLHLLDYLANQATHPIINKSRPLTLWDKRSLTHNRFEENISPEDVWRRSVLYSRTPATCSREKQSIQDGVYYSTSQIYPSTGTAGHCATIMLQQFTQSFYINPLKSEKELDALPIVKKRTLVSCKKTRHVVESFDSGSYSQSLLI